jgi:omega-6 fatty acid desaturase (delta-12 desaturase)
MSAHTSNHVNATNTQDAKRVMAITAKYQAPSLVASYWQLISTSVCLFGMFALAIWSYHAQLPYLLTLLLSAVAGGFVLKLFIIQHDCGHGSFFESRTANDVVGTICSLFTLIPYYYWRRQHAIHHATNGNLDKRGHGDMDIVTVREYLKLSSWERLKYRIYRNPIGFLFFGPVVFFLIINRRVIDFEKTTARERSNVWWTNLAVTLFVVALGFAIGWSTFLAVIAPAVYISGAAGIWMFYIQHQFEHTYWRPEREWDYTAAAMQGSSFYKLPKVLQWITGNIGFHHIHHLKPSIPNYRLEKCHYENPEFQDVPTLTLLSSLKTMFLCVWDEDQRRLISFSELYARYGKSPLPEPNEQEVRLAEASPQYGTN